jgi:purine-cytosine permease-like protein
MYSSPILAVMITGVLISLALIIAAVYFVNKMFSNDTQEILVKFILLVFTALVSVYVVDKIIAFRIPLLSDAQDKDLFDLIKTLILMIFSYYFGTKKEKK